MTDEQNDNLDAIRATLQALAHTLNKGDGTATTLCMAAATFRKAAETLDTIADQWISQGRIPSS